MATGDVLQGDVQTLGRFADGGSAIVKADKPDGGEVVYLGFWPLGEFLPKFVQV